MPIALNRDQNKKFVKGVFVMKKLTTVIGIILLAGLIAYPVFAHGPGWGWGKGHHMMGRWGGGPGYYCGQYQRGYENLTPEQQTKLDELNRNFFNETNTLRNELWAKSSELNLILNSPNPDTEKAKALQKEINDLKAQMAEKRLELDLEARKTVPDVPRRSAWGYGHHRGAYGHHRGGYGPHMGYGGQMGDYGPGGCWQ